MKTRFGSEGTGTSGALEPQLSSWLRGFDPGEAPIGLRVRISADLRAETERRRSWRPLLTRSLSLAAASVVVLIGAIVVILAAAAGGAASTVGSPVTTLPGQTLNPMTDTQASGGLSLTLLAVLLIVSGLSGASTTLSPIRRLGGWLVGTGRTVQPAKALPRRLPAISRLALALTLLAILEIVWSLDVYGVPFETSVSWLISQLLSLGLAPAIALRYRPEADRSARWLLVGAIAIALANLPELALSTAAQWGWFDNTDLGVTLSNVLPFVVLSVAALGWLSIGVGIAARSGVARLPGRFVVAVAIALVLYTEVTGSIDFAAGLAAQNPLVPEAAARVAWQTVATCLQDLVWLVILWTALVRVAQVGVNGAWKLALVAAATAAALRVYFSLVIAGQLPLIDWQPLNFLSWLGSAALLLAVLIGLNPPRNEHADPLEVTDQTG